MKLLSHITVFLSVAPVIILVPALLMSRRADRTANFFLGTVIFVISYVVLSITAAKSGFLDIFPGWMALPVPFAFLIPVGFYFYFQKLFEPAWRLRFFHLLHLVPAIICWLVLTPWYWAPVEVRYAYYDPEPFSVRWWCGVIYFTSMTIYCVVIWKMFRRFEERLANVRSEIEQFKVARLKFFMGVFVLQSFLTLLTIVTLGKSPYLEIAIFVASTSLVAIALYALRWSPMLQVVSTEFVVNDVIPEGEYAQSPKYETSGLAPEALEPLSRRLLQHLETSRCYTESNLKLADLARAVKLSEYQTSQVINVGLKENFFTLINRYRIEEAKRRLSNGNAEAANILEVAYEVGFNSKSSFNNAFRKWAGMTPSEFRKKSASHHEAHV